MLFFVKKKKDRLCFIVYNAGHAVVQKMSYTSAKSCLFSFHSGIRIEICCKKQVLRHLNIVLCFQYQNSVRCPIIGRFWRSILAFEPLCGGSLLNERSKRLKPNKSRYSLSKCSQTNTATINSCSTLLLLVYQFVYYHYLLLC